MQRWLFALAVGCVALTVGISRSHAQDLRSVWDGVYTEDQARAGEAVYVKICAHCHGFSLEGGEQAPPMVGGAFLSNWDQLTGGDLMDRIRKTMPSNAPGTLGRADAAVVLAYVLKSNGFPAGETQLDQRTEFLRGIRIDATAPAR